LIQNQALTIRSADRGRDGRHCELAAFDVEQPVTAGRDACDGNDCMKANTIPLISIAIMTEQARFARSTRSTRAARRSAERFAALDGT
jgi:hypothetical protein